MPTNFPHTKIGSGDEDTQNGNNRRASLPANIKIPDITITPSTPSPEPQAENVISFEFGSWKTVDEEEDAILSADSRSSTPDIDEVLSCAKTDEEQKRVLRFKQKQSNL